MAVKGFITLGPGTNAIKRFYGRNLQMFVLTKLFDPGRPFQPSQMFVA
jgi:hypothetical protein